MRVFLVAALLAAAVPASADPPPPPPEPTPTLWKASATLGIMYVDGNAFSLGISGTALGGMRHGDNAAELFVQGAYGKAGTSTVMNGPVDGEKLSAASWLWHARYDRYFVKKNTAYLLFRMNGDQLAGINYRIEPQVGYARIFLESKRQQFRGEIGYTYTYEDYLGAASPANADFHSGRLFLYYENKFSPYAQFSEGVELLEAFNKLDHFRLNSITSLSSQISKYVSLKVNFTVRYNHDPPSRPPPLMGTFGKVDTILEAVFAVTFI